MPSNKGWFEEVWVPIHNRDPGDENVEGHQVFFQTRHPNSMKFHRYLKEVANLHDIKQRDYGRDDDPFANVRASEEWGIEGWVGAMVRLHDKVRRLQTLAQNGELSNEGAIDSFMDIACYAIIARVLFEDVLD